MNEEEVQTALSCEADDPPKRFAKMFVDRGMQTVFSYDPDLSNTAIRTELRTKEPNHEGGVATDAVVEQADEGGVATDAGGSSAQTDLSYQTATDETLFVSFGAEDAGGEPTTEGENGGENVEIGDAVDREESIDVSSPDETTYYDFSEVESNLSFYTSTPRASQLPKDEDDVLLSIVEEGGIPEGVEEEEKEDGDVSVQTGMTLGTGTVPPNAPGQGEATTSSDKSKETAVQTKFGGYPVDQSDTLIIEELQSRFPEHSQDAVVEPQGAGEGGDDSEPPLGGGEDAAVSDEATDQPEPESAALEENGDEPGMQNGDVTEGEPASTSNGVDSGAQTFFSYDPMMSNSELVDELANAYPKHSTENAVVVESEPPVDVAPEEGAIPTSRTESRESFQSAVTSQPNIEDVELSQAVDEVGGEEQAAITEEEAQTGIVCGVGKTCPEKTSGNEVSERRSMTVQTVFGGYNVDQSDTRIIEELQFKDPVHSQRGSLEVVEETSPNPTEETDEIAMVQEEKVEEVDEVDVVLEVETAQDEPDTQAAEDTAQGEDVTVDAEMEESGELFLSFEETKDGEVEEAIQETKTETIETGDLPESDDGTAVQTMLTCASLEDYPSKATRYVEQATQTVFSYDPDLSNTQILAELRTKQPEHESALPPSSEEAEQDEGAVAVENAEADNADGAEGDEVVPAAEEDGEGAVADENAETEAVPEAGEEAVETTPNSPEEADVTETGESGESEELPDIGPGVDNAEAKVTETESTQFNENIQTDITCGIGSSTQLGSSNDKTQQTFFSYDSNVSNSQVIPELQSGHPIHSQLAVENAVTMPEECRGPCRKYARGRGEGSLPGVIDSESEDNDTFITTTEGDRTDVGDVADLDSELGGMSSKPTIVGGSKSMSAAGTDSDDPTSRSRSYSYPPDKNDVPNVNVDFSTKMVVEEETDGDERQDTGAQTQIIFGTGTTPQGINEKASNTYFTYDPTQSDSQIVDELKTGKPVHSGGAVSFVTQDKEPAGSDESLFNDDWEKNESSGEGEIEVQDINATNSKASDWLGGESDVETSDADGENEGLAEELDVELTLVVESEDFVEEDGKQKTMIQTDLSFGDTLEPLPVSQRNVDSSLSVHIMFSLQVGHSTNTMEMKVPKTDLDPSDAAFTAKFNAEFAGGGLEQEKLPIDQEGNERVRCTLPILVTVTCENRTDESGNAILEPVVDLIFQKPPSNLLPALEDQPGGVPDIAPDETDNAPEPSEEKREMEIQTDLVLGALLFSESITSVGGEEGFESASEGAMPDEELILPSPPMEEPCSRTNVSWAEGSLEDVETGAEEYVDLHLRVDPNEACNQQYVQQLVPSSRSQEACPVTDKSTTRTLMKITTAELLYVPDKVSSLTARNTEDKRVHVTGQKLHRWGFPHENTSSNITVIPDTFGIEVRNESTSGVLDNAGNLVSSSQADTTSGRVLTAVATRVIFEFHTSEEDFLSTDGRAPAVKSKIAFQILGSRGVDNKASHVATLNLQECIAPSKVMYVADGEVTSKVLQPEGSPLELPVDGEEPLVLKLALPQPRRLDDESLATTTAIRKVPFTIAQVGDETLTTTKDLVLGGSPLQFTVPLGDGYGTMTVAAKIEENSTDEESPEVITMTTTFEEVDIQEVPEDGTAPPTREPCECYKSKSRKPANALAEGQEENEVPIEEGGKSKTITAMFIKDGVPGEKQTKVLRPGGSPMYVNLPSSGVPVRAKLALAPQPDDEDRRSTSEGADLKTKVSCKIIQDGVEKETKTKLMEAGGSPLRFDLPLGSDGFLTANVVIPKPDDDDSGESPPGESGGAAADATEECICDTVDPCVCQTEEKPLPRPQTYSGDRCFDVITEALATYAREIDPLKKALEEITEKVKELNMPELAGIGEPPSMSYHSLDEFDDRQQVQELLPPPPPPPPPPPMYQHKITLQSGMSRVSTTFNSRPPNQRQQRPVNSPSSQRQWGAAPPAQRYPGEMPPCQQRGPQQGGRAQTPTCPLYQNPTSYSLPEGTQGGRCPLARPPDQYQSEQLYAPPPPQQHQRRSSCQASGGYAERPQPPPRCSYADDPNVRPPPRQNQGYGPPGQDPRYYDVGVRLSQQPPYQYPMQGYPTTPNQEYDEYAPSAVNIRSRVYLSSEGPRAREQDPRSCNPDTGYEEYGPQQRSPIAEMYIKLSQNSRSSQFYEEDEDSMYDDADDDGGYGSAGGYGGGYQRRGYRTPSQKKLGNRGRDDDRRKGKPRGSKGCACSVSATDVATSVTTVELSEKESYWCDPEDVSGSTKPGNLGNAAPTTGVN